MAIYVNGILVAGGGGSSGGGTINPDNIKNVVKMDGGANIVTAGITLNDGEHTIEFTEEENESGNGETAANAENINYNNETSGMQATNVQSAIDELFQSASEGKSLIASAVTGKGVETAADASFETIAENIGKISDSSNGVLSYSVYSSAITFNTSTYKITIPVSNQGREWAHIELYINKNNGSGDFIVAYGYLRFLDSSTQGLAQGRVALDKTDSTTDVLKTQPWIVTNLVSDENSVSFNIDQLFIDNSAFTPNQILIDFYNKEEIKIK